MQLAYTLVRNPDLIGLRRRGSRDEKEKDNINKIEDIALNQSSLMAVC